MQGARQFLADKFRQGENAALLDKALASVK